MPDILVVKRDGHEKTFDADKIVQAAKKAGATDEIAQAVADDVSKVVETRAPRRSKPISVEEIQDLVEEALMSRAPAAAKAYILYREKRREARDARQKPDPTAIADFTTVSKYARFDPDLKRREVWAESTARSRAMHTRRFPKIAARIDEVFTQYVDTKFVLPSMRSVQFGGAAMEKNHCRGYNCCFTLADRPRVFAEMFYLLLSGCGVGFSVQRRHVKSLPVLNRIDRTRVWWHEPEDSIEGWASCLEVLVDSYMTSGFQYSGAYVDFDFRNIRPMGKLLVTSGGKAPGHVPLKMMLEKVRTILDKAQGRKMYPIEVHDICCHVAEAVLAGGIRRSSLISLFSPDDVEMLKAKTGDWLKTAPQRVMANNSVVIVRGDAHMYYDLFCQIFDAMREYGEPGFFFTPHENYGCNPCGEIGLNPVGPDGRTGFAFCNLTEINATMVKDADDFIQACQAASFIGTLQASYTDFPFLSSASKEIAEREALLGVSITGLMDNPMIMDPDLLRMGAAAAIDMNRRVAAKLGIKPAARVTTVKPSGTASLLLGCVGSGIHPHHSRRYIRRMTCNPNEPPFQHFKKINPHMCVEKENGDWVIEFPVQVRDDAILRDDMSAIDFMEKVFNLYENWILPGTAGTMTSPGLTHNVSCTVTVKDGEWETAREFAWKNRDRVAAMSFLAYSGDKKYPFAPREAIVDSAGEARWNELISKYKKVDWTQFREADDATNPTEVGACEGPACEIRR